MPQAQSRGVIVYLTQSGRHSSYGRDSSALLRESVRLLFANYNAAQLDDLWFLHQGDVRLEEQQSVLRMCHPANAKYVTLDRRHFELPRSAKEMEMPAQVRKMKRAKQQAWRRQQRRWVLPLKYTEGYRHMIRFFTLGLWDLVAAAGYEYVMRMDEDSFLRSPIRYNLFDFVASRGFEYAYRLSSWEADPNPTVFGTFHALVRDHIERHGLTEQVERSGWLLEPCVPPRTVANFTLRRCGPILGPYNNFFVTRVGFWRRPDVQAFLRTINESQTIYFERLNDILWHGAAYQLFLRRSQVHMFNDFAYEHMTSRPVPVGNRTEYCMGHGGYAIGNLTVNDGAAARARLLWLMNERNRQSALAERNRQYYLNCHRLITCYFGATADGHMAYPDLGIMLGSVNAMQPVCGREPEPYYCDSGGSPGESKMLMATAQARTLTEVVQMRSKIASGSRGGCRAGRMFAYLRNTRTSPGKA